MKLIMPDKAFYGRNDIDRTISVCLVPFYAGMGVLIGNLGGRWWTVLLGGVLAVATFYFLLLRKYHRDRDRSKRCALLSVKKGHDGLVLRGLRGEGSHFTVTCHKRRSWDEIGAAERRSLFKLTLPDQQGPFKVFDPTTGVTFGVYHWTGYDWTDLSDYYDEIVRDPDVDTIRSTPRNRS